MFAQPKTALTPQAATLLRHLNAAGSITQREAMADHSIQSLTKRVSELRRAGIPISTVNRKHPVTNQRYARYYLVDTPERLSAVRKALQEERRKG